MTLSFLSDQLLLSGILSDARWAQSGNVLQGYARFRTGHTVPIYLICVTAANWPIALLRYTGPQLIWRQIQDAAVDRGYRLDESGLYQNQQALHVRNEKEIFKLVNVEYLPPEDRG
jgi:DNA polymerase/3'-5' exonuclease PolX